MDCLLVLYLIIFIICDFKNVFGCSFGYYNDANQCSDCGLTQFQPNVKIVGGVDATKGSWPYHVFIKKDVYIPNSGYNSFYCGGTLINKNTVLTAGHCVSSYSSYYPTYTAYLGAYNISFIKTGLTKPAEVVVSSVSKVILHESYNTNTDLNDIALLILDTSITPNDYINIACLPDISNTFPGVNQISYAVGWGLKSEFATSIANILQNVNLTVYSSSYCNNVYPSVTKNWDSQICAGEYYGGKDTCQGDSGGGLFVSQVINGQTKYIVVGVTSYGWGCARSGYPGIYTRTSYFTDWITSKINQLSGLVTNPSSVPTTFTNRTTANSISYVSTSKITTASINGVSTSKITTASINGVYTSKIAIYSDFIIRNIYIWYLLVKLWNDS